MTRQDMFFYGTLCHLPLLTVVLGRPPVCEAARMAGWRAHWAKGRPHPMLIEDPDGWTEGLLVRGLTATEQDRLDYYEGGFDFLTRRVRVETGQGPVPALVYVPAATGWKPGAPWSLADWAGRFGDAITATAHDVMALMGKVPAEAVLARYGQMLVRGASRVRAARDPSPARLRRASSADQVQVQDMRQPYAQFFAVEEHDLRFRRFDGSMSEVITRATFVSGDAVTVLPYDPGRDRVLLIEQFRAGPFARGDRNPWSLEAIAGRIDPGETAEDCARREAAEEAGLTLGQLLPVASYYPSPGAKTEFLYSFVGLADLPDGVAGVHGVAEEAEDIRGHLVSFDSLMDLVATGEAGNGPLILTALWLQRERPRLRR
jgi:nudix-type nucleoside diphosphatase (YffH/AdpP family)